MGVPEPPCWAGGMSPGVPSSPQARMSPPWPPAAAGCADAQQITLALTLRCRGALSQQPPWLASVPSCPCRAPLYPPAASLGRFLCGTVNDFVAEVGRAYKRATENKQEAELMARKVGCRGAGGLGRAGWHSPRAVEGLAASAPAAHARAVPEVPRHLGCPGQLGVSRHTGFPNT